MMYCLEITEEPHTLVFFTGDDMSGHREETEAWLTKRIGIRCIVIDLTDAVYGDNAVPTLRGRADTEDATYARCLRDLALAIEDERGRRKEYRRLFR
jgi:hypothetical protein|uniref:Uncharacterized protein n=1 Tax=Siphoviridae sp. ctwfx1 TaxID=2825732 RepID=A0A8S5UVF6_9CAUD|nr:MAG TPA: hypothetical protein [Siphoviridae sp. ctwfx1]